MKTVRKLVLGETWVLPIGVGLAVGVAGLLSAVAGDAAWWRDLGGFVLLGLVIGALLASVGRPAEP